jgi:hypothetical protein
MRPRSRSSWVIAAMLLAAPASMALGVHLGNRRRGSLPLDVISGWDGGVTTAAFVGIPIAQLAATVVVERASGRARARRAP